MNISLRHLRAFAAISRAGSFTVAANQLHVSQSALSVLVKDLEDDLGVCLLDRTTRNVRVSEVGLAFLPQVQRILEDLEHAIHSIADLRDLKRGVARIAAPQLMSVTLVPSVLAAHRARNIASLIDDLNALRASTLGRLVTRGTRNKKPADWARRFFYQSRTRAAAKGVATDAPKL